MTNKKHQNQTRLLDQLVSLLLRFPGADVFSEVWKAACSFVQAQVPKGPYEVLEYESTLEFLDPEGTHATFTKRERVRYLQDNIIAYQDQAWGDGEVRVARR